MRNLLVTLRFDGRTFCGWQVQKNAPTIMQTFQDALEAVLKHRPDVKGCSRTDSGVSAAMYCVSFFTDNRIPCERLVPALNVKLPPTIAATACCEVPQDFHARYSCKGKRYCYRILNRSVRDPFYEGLALHLPYRLDVDFLHAQAQQFIGTFDFAAFQNSGSSIVDTVRTIFDCSVTRCGDLIEFSVAGNGFLYNMVRIMTGTLLDIAQGNLETDSIPDIIASRDRRWAGMTAPARGLMLMEVYYDELFSAVDKADI
ncbi:tRNA pseudouridine(38-40) synthase TruA [Oscillospiraceae bacterium LTW-04]|nr:tRNA pseudouridine(38-40) synthase TruA [Oscillospiraceae bacterium MB24-C1]